MINARMQKRRVFHAAPSLLHAIEAEYAAYEVWRNARSVGIFRARRRDTMVAVTYDPTGVAQHARDKAIPSKPATAPKRERWFVRLLNALQESQMRRAAREIALHRHLLPHDLELFGDRLSPRSEDALPFGRG
jgi:hypothetical protein